MNINIKDALKNQRPNDKIVRVLSNKYAIIKASFTNSTFDNESICGLKNGVIFCYCLSVKNKDIFFKKVLSEPNIRKTFIAYNLKNGDIEYRRKTIDKRRIKQETRKIIELLN
jgi:hypothetical protein